MAEIRPELTLLRSWGDAALSLTQVPVLSRVPVRRVDRLAGFLRTPW
jgi:hypothetical protein